MDFEANHANKACPDPGVDRRGEPVPGKQFLQAPKSTGSFGDHIAQKNPDGASTGPARVT